MTGNIHVGFEVGTGAPVRVPLKHTAVTGQTQESGKTTTLEAMVSRAGVPALAFITKRGESSFADGKRLLPYFRDRADWQFVDQLLEAQLREKNKFLRPWIIKLCRNTRTLADVQREVRHSMGKAKGLSEGVYTQLDAYLDLIVPEIGRATLASSIDLGPGLNVMDLSGYSGPMQMLFVQSAIDWVNANEKHVITIIPEAWETIPEGKGSPVKASAVALVRKGAGIGNFIWVDSQDMAGVDKTILRGCAVWLIGVQRELNEIKRNIGNIPAGIKRPKPADVAGLSRGQFFVCWGEHTIKAYVQPAWMGADQALAIAQGTARIGSAPRIEDLPPSDPAISPQPMIPSKNDFPNEEDTMTPAQEKKLDDVHGMLQRMARSDGPASSNGHPAPQKPSDEEALYQRFKERLLRDLPLSGGAPLQVMAPEKLRKDFQREEADRIVAVAKTLPDLSKRVLKLLEATNDRLGQPTIAARLGRSNSGNASATLAKAIKDLADLGFAETKPREGTRKTVREKIASDLALYQATPEDIEATYQAVLFAIATEENGN